MANFKSVMNDLSKTLQAAGVKAKAAKSFVGRYSKPAAFIESIRAGNELVKNIPIIGKMTAWVNSTNDKIFNSTFGKIPGIGKILIKINELGREVFKSPINNPNWYTGSEAHSVFRISTGYPENIGYNGTSKKQYKASLITIPMVMNPFNCISSITTKASQFFDVLKAVRGLSVMNYNSLTLIQYQQMCYYLINEYCKLRFFLRVSSVYSLIKSPLIPDTFVKDYFSDMQEKRALYEGLLLRMRGEIQNIALLPIDNLATKIMSMWDCFIPDSNDVSVAMMYKLIPHILANSNMDVETDQSSTSEVDIYGHGFKHLNRVLSENVEGSITLDLTNADQQAMITFISGVNASWTNLTYESYLAGYVQLMSKLNTDVRFSLIKGDIMGAFGSAAIIQLPDLNTRVDKFEDLVGPYDELMLAQIQNGQALDTARIAVRETNNTVTSKSISKIEIPLVYSEVHLSEDFNPVTVSYLPGTNNPSLFYISKLKGIQDGQFSMTSFPRIDTQIPVNAFKYDMNDGESIEILEMSTYVDYLTTEGSGSTAKVLIGYLTTEFVPLQYVAYCWSGTGTNLNSYTERVILHDLYATNATGPEAVVLSSQWGGILSVWAQADWAPVISYTHLNVADSIAQVGAGYLLDQNIVGSVSAEAWKLAIRNAAYFLRAKTIPDSVKKLDNALSVLK